MLTEVKFTPAFNAKVNKVLEEYADGMEHSHKHWSAKRNASKPREDSLVGKKGEFFVAHFLSEEYNITLTPDVTIYSSRKKNWDADLPYSAKFDFPDVHVKTCSQKTLDFAKTYSWTFQSGNGNGFFGTDKLLTHPEYDVDLLALIFVPEWQSDTAVLHHLVKWKDAKTVLADPISPRLKGIKLCLYTDDLNKSKKIEDLRKEKV